MIDYEKINGTPYGLPEWLIDRLEKCPPSGGNDDYPEGVHSDWMPSMANCLAHYVEPDEAVEIIKEYMTRKPTPPDEVERTVENIYAHKDYSGETFVPLVRKEKIAKQPDQMYAIWLEQGADGVERLKAESDPTPKTWGALLALFPGDEDLICYGGPNLSKDGKEKLNGYWACTNEKWELTAADLSAWPLIVPNPMTDRFGKTKEGRSSPRTLENAAIFRKYLVMDFDLVLDGPFAEPINNVIETGRTAREAIHSLTAAVILWLREQTDIPLIMVVDSGGKSLHAWWYVFGLEESKQREFFYKAAAFGADASVLKSNHQFVRMPGGTREVTGARQEIIYWKFYGPRQ